MSWFKRPFKSRPQPEKAALDAATVELAKAQQEGRSALKQLLHVLDVPVEQGLSVATGLSTWRERK